MNLQRLFDPDAVAVVGASANEDKIGYEAMASAVRFDGPVYPVNPSGEGELFGEPFVDSVTDVDGVDLALLCVPAPVVPDVIAECGEAGVGAAVIYSGGFAEAGEEGEELQRTVVDAAAEHDIALLGPNTSGYVVPGSDLLFSFASGVETVPAGDVAVLAQSGGVAHDLAFRSTREGYGLSAMVGLGNRANVGFEEAIEYFDGHDDTDAIVLHVEGTDDARGLLETCRDAETPVAAYKVGQSDVGEFAESHTGALTGDHDLYLAGFEQYGVPTVDSTAALLDAGVALAHEPEPSGANVGVVTAQAGPGIIIADRLQRAGATLPELGAETRERIDEILPGITFSGNPVDTGRPMPEFGEVVEAVAADDAIDAVLVYELFEEALGFPVEALDGLHEATGTPVLFATEGPPDAMADQVDALREAGVPVYVQPERAAEATATLARYADLREAGAVPESAAEQGVSR
ncbi:CoA-binding protein (plasmid) [Halobaculum sp. CBA1158]|uniref:CoA-binding protein n=1 Tax=Halobaculum sp. CBA1158 TaxID=2904243 RepID=UPI001F448841|nr:CoA-binding protein [Halobaculum sp. CBA1158]UIP01483.1 CoA-binding protein [Halobaculum sp. CBA1158]